MKIFYINTDKFLKSHDFEFLRKYSDNKDFKNENRFIQHCIGRYLVISAADKFFGIENDRIIVENGKPKFAKSKLCFSIAHSKNIVAAAFDVFECGIDVEEMKLRNFNLFAERYGKNFESAESFYAFWTEYEAGIKLRREIQSKFSAIIEQKFMLTAVSEQKGVSAEIKEYC